MVPACRAGDDGYLAIPARLDAADGGGWWTRCMASLGVLRLVDPAARLELSYSLKCDIRVLLALRRVGVVGKDEVGGGGGPSGFPGRLRPERGEITKTKNR